MQAKELASCPHPALLGRDGEVAQLNEKAGALFPELKAGSPLPDALLIPEGEFVWEGCVVLEGRAWQVSASALGEDTLYQLLPMEQTALTEGQLDGSLYQLRTLMYRFRRELAPYVSGEKDKIEADDRAEFARDYYRMLRLIDHLDLLRDAADGQIRPRLGVLELGMTVHRIAVECDGLLRSQGIAVEYQGIPGNLMVQGDIDQLRTALLELISNCALRLKQGGTISVRISKRGERAAVCVTDDGPPAGPVQRAAMTTRGGLPRIPMGDMGAGLGMSVAEEIIRAHGGAMLVSAGAAAPCVWLSLPLTRRLNGGDVHFHTTERNAGMSPYIIALSDVLPGEIVLADWLD